MDSIIMWLRELFVEPSVTQTLLLFSIVSGVGLLLGKLRIGRVSLGITFVFFLGIVLSYIGFKYVPGFALNLDMISFCQNFGLVLFIYALGVEVGPSFFPSLKKGGIVYNMMGLAVVLVALIICVVIYYIPGLGLTMPTLTGLMSGAVTNTPILAAAQTTLAEIAPAGVSVTSELSTMAQACAVAYPMGVIGVLFVLVLLGGISGKRAPKAEKGSRKAFFSQYKVCNPALDGRSVREIVALTDRNFVISRIWREGQVAAAASDTVLHIGDKLLAVSSEEDVKTLETLFGRRQDDKDWNDPSIEWSDVDSSLTSHRAVITKDEINGVKLGTLRLRNLYGINITRIDRAGIELLPNPDLHLQLGDRLTIVGEEAAVDKVVDILGDQVTSLERPNLISIFVGIFLGCLVGMIPIFLPGMSMPIKLGLAGGPVIVGILMGAFGPRLKFSTYITNSATQMMKQLGIILYLAGIGLVSGEGFFDVLVTSTGLTWLLLGAVITIVPPLIVGVIAMKFFKVDLGSASGMICGAMANPMVLDFASSQSGDDRPSVVYATVYPLGMFVRIITAQILIVLFTAF